MRCNTLPRPQTFGGGQPQPRFKNLTQNSWMGKAHIFQILHQKNYFQERYGRMIIVHFYISFLFQIRRKIIYLKLVTICDLKKWRAKILKTVELFIATELFTVISKWYIKLSNGNTRFNPQSLLEKNTGLFSHTLPGQAERVFDNATLILGSQNWPLKCNLAFRKHPFDVGSQNWPNFWEAKTDL